MKLYIRFGSLYSFQQLYNGSEYLQNVLEKINSTTYKIDESADVSEIEKLLKSRKIKYAIE